MITTSLSYKIITYDLFFIDRDDVSVCLTVLSNRYCTESYTTFEL